MADGTDAQKLRELEDRADEADRRVTALEQKHVSSAPAGTIEVLHAIKVQLAKAKEQQLKLEASEATLKQQNQRLQKRNAELEKQNDKHEYRILHLKHWAQVKPEAAS